MTLKKYSDFLHQKKAVLSSLVMLKEKNISEQEELECHLGNLEKAREIMSKVGILSQQEIKQVIEELTTQGLQAVFGPEYSFEMVDQLLRNKPETVLYVNVSGRRHQLKGELGGGVVDLVAFCLRIIMWAITSPRTANVLILDEPLKFVDKIRLEQVGVMIKRLSEMFGLQFIVVTHEDQLMEAADRAYFIEKKGKVSEVECTV